MMTLISAPPLPENYELTGRTSGPASLFPIMRHVHCCIVTYRSFPVDKKRTHACTHAQKHYSKDCVCLCVSASVDVGLENFVAHTYVHKKKSILELGLLSTLSYCQTGHLCRQVQPT